MSRLAAYRPTRTLEGHVKRLRAAKTRAAVQIQTRSRTRKWELYEASFPPRPGERVLDVGVSSYDDLPNENYFLRRYPYPSQLTAVGIQDLTELRERFPEVTFVTADGRSLPFSDLAFDVVHSNAVVEHVGTREDQERFVSELVRVGRAGFVTTPNRWFPIETHCKLPFVHWLPRRASLWLLARLGKKKVNWLLLSARGFRSLFPPTVRRTSMSTKVLRWPVTLVLVYRRSAGAFRGSGEHP